jgi:PIN domain nuclease of toxin-antitoxin system
MGRTPAGYQVAVLDASALVAFLVSEPAARAVEPLLRAKSKMSAVNIAEVVDVLLRGAGVQRDELDRALGRLTADGSLKVIDVTGPIARRAGELRSMHYHRTRCDVSIADCIALATAESAGEPLATTDGHLVVVARDLGLEVIDL